MNSDDSESASHVVVATACWEARGSPFANTGIVTPANNLKLFITQTNLMNSNTKLCFFLIINERSISYSQLGPYDISCIQYIV